MEKIKIGIIKEGKNPPDKRVALTPNQCVQIKLTYPHVDIVVQRSLIRAISDSEYQDLGLTLVNDLSNCDIIIGVKEVNEKDLIPNKTYLFFSHTFKKQPYNRSLLQNIIDKKIRLIDYEVIKNEKGVRVIGFGRYAGVVGCYNAFLAYGLKHQLYTLKAAHLCADRKEMEAELTKIKLPSSTKIVLTGWGRVGYGAQEIMTTLDLKEVKPEAFLNSNFNTPVFTHLDVEHYNQRSNDSGFDKIEFFKDGVGYESTFMPYAKTADLYIACHYWKEGSPFIFTREDVKSKDWNISVVADISCDIDGPVATTLRPSTIANPLYGYNSDSETEVDFMNNKAIGVMAVDNLPCELPKDASEDFGNEMLTHVLPYLLEKDDGRIDKASETTLKGELNSHFKYLLDYLKGK